MNKHQTKLKPLKKESLNMILQLQSIENIVENNLKTFALYDALHNIYVKIIGEGKWWVGYRTNQRIGTLFDLNYCEDIRTLYILYIQLDNSQQGKGHGSQLYEIIVNIAKELNCLIIEQTPSGWTSNGYTRANYLVRRGWTIANNVAIKKLNPTEVKSGK